VVPIVTAKLVQDLLAINFMGHSVDDVIMGLHPFIINDGHLEHHQTNMEIARFHRLLQSGSTFCSLDDLEALNAEDCSVPLICWELEQLLEMFGNLIAVVLRLMHSLVTAFRLRWTLMMSNIRDDLHQAIVYCT